MRSLRILIAAARDRSGIAMTEFAMALPLLLVLGMYGIEIAYMHTVNMQVSQIAMGLADNASRLGQTDNSAVAPTISNVDIDSVMFGAIKQGGPINFQANGRLILSSLESTPSGQIIRWQKCRGSLVKTSTYGAQGTAVDGMGKTGRTITANSNSAVMFVEAYYNYKPLFGTMFVKPTVLGQEAAFIVRDNRAVGNTISGTGGSEC